jgi:integral membrane protein (TIGR01906 family)
MEVVGVKLSPVKKIVFWLLAVCIPVLLVTSALRWAVDDIRLYEYGFKKYAVERDTGISRQELRRVAMALIDYFNFRTDEAQVIVNRAGERVALFNQRELIHLSDVRDLVRLNSSVQMAALMIMTICAAVLAILSKQRWLALSKAALLGGGLTFGLAMALAVWCWVGFDQFFYLFHIASFRNEFWILNPAEDYLIKLFPGDFFYDAALLVFGSVLTFSLLLVVVSLCVLRFFGSWSEPNTGQGGPMAQTFTSRN